MFFPTRELYLVGNRVCPCPLSIPLQWLLQLYFVGTGGSVLSLAKAVYLQARYLGTIARSWEVKSTQRDIQELNVAQSRCF